MTINLLPDADEWDPWTPQQLAERFTGCGPLWGIAGGWALDLWLGRYTRPHSDIEVVIARSALDQMRGRLSDQTLYAAKNGMYEPLDQAAPEEIRQVWVLDQGARKWRLDLMLDPGDEGLWIYRRDARIQALRSKIIAYTAEGIPYLRPHIVLLFKGKNPRAKDYTDLAVCLGELKQEEINWLQRALVTAHPQSPWLKLPIWS